MVGAWEDVSEPGCPSNLDALLVLAPKKEPEIEKFLTITSPGTPSLLPAEAPFYNQALYLSYKRIGYSRLTYVRWGS